MHNSREETMERLGSRCFDDYSIFWQENMNHMYGGTAGREPFLSLLPCVRPGSSIIHIYTTAHNLLSRVHLRKCTRMVIVLFVWKLGCGCWKVCSLCRTTQPQEALARGEEWIESIPSNLGLCFYRVFPMILLVVRFCNMPRFCATNICSSWKEISNESKYCSSWIYDFLRKKLGLRCMRLSNRWYQRSNTFCGTSMCPAAPPVSKLLM